MVLGNPVAKKAIQVCMVLLPLTLESRQKDSSNNMKSTLHPDTTNKYQNKRRVNK